jgi:hypothetical protein
MDLDKNYKYFSQNPFNEKINYSYSEYIGKIFIEKWKDYRCLFIKKSKRVFTITDFIKEDVRTDSTQNIFNKWILAEKEIPINQFNLLLKRFEVTKKIYSTYDLDFRPTNSRDSSNILFYLMFSYLLIFKYRETKKFNYLNALIKINDIICSALKINSDIGDYSVFVNWVLTEEIKIIDSTQKKLKQ